MIEGAEDIAASALRHFTARRLSNKLWVMDGEETTVSKRQLGIALLFVGLLGFSAILAIDILDVGRQGGIGPAQTVALLVMAATAVVGLTLIPLGDAPA